MSTQPPHDFLTTGTDTAFRMLSARVDQLRAELAEAREDAHRTAAERDELRAAVGELAPAPEGGPAVPDLMAALKASLVDARLVRVERDLELNKAGWAAEIERTKRLEDELGQIWDALGIAEDDDPGPDAVGDIRGLKIAYREMKIAQKDLAALRTAVAAIADSAERMAESALDHSAHQRTNPAGATEDSELLAQVSDVAALALRTTVARLRTALGGPTTGDGS